MFRSSFKEIIYYLQNLGLFWWNCSKCKKTRITRFEVAISQMKQCEISKSCIEFLDYGWHFSPWNGIELAVAVSSARLRLLFLNLESFFDWVSREPTIAWPKSSRWLDRIPLLSADGKLAEISSFIAPLFRLINGLLLFAHDGGQCGLPDWFISPVAHPWRRVLFCWPSPCIFIKARLYDDPRPWFRWKIITFNGIIS